MKGDENNGNNDKKICGSLCWRAQWRHFKQRWYAQPHHSIIFISDLCNVVAPFKFSTTVYHLVCSVLSLYFPHTWLQPTLPFLLSGRLKNIAAGRNQWWQVTLPITHPPTGRHSPRACTRVSWGYLHDCDDYVSLGVWLRVWHRDVDREGERERGMDGERKTAETQRAKEDVSLCDSSSISACLRARVCVHPRAG